MTILLYVRRKEWPLESVTVRCTHERARGRDVEGVEHDDDARVELIRRHIVLKGEITEEQRERIAYIATRCPMHRTLETPPHVTDQVEVVTQA